MDLCFQRHIVIVLKHTKVEDMVTYYVSANMNQVLSLCTEGYIKIIPATWSSGSLLVCFRIDLALVHSLIRQFGPSNIYSPVFYDVKKSSDVYSVCSALILHDADYPCFILKNNFFLKINNDKIQTCHIIY
jgi:hypothetical protein